MPMLRVGRIPRFGPLLMLEERIQKTLSKLFTLLKSKKGRHYRKQSARNPENMFPSKNGLFLRVETFESSQKCPEFLDGFLSQTTKFLINPFTRRCTLTNVQGGGTRNPQEGNNAVCLRVGNCEKTNWPGQPAKKKALLFSGKARNVQNLWIASCPKPQNSLSIPLQEDAP